MYSIGCFLVWLLLVVLLCILAALGMALGLSYPNPIRQRTVHQPAAILYLELGRGHQKVIPEVFADTIAWYIPPRAAKAVWVLMVHGRSGNKEENVPLAGRLVAEGFGVYLFDMPGCGQNSFGRMAAAQAGVELVRAAVIRVQRKMCKGDKLVVYGHSLGGVLALQLQETAPDLAGIISDSA